MKSPSKKRLRQEPDNEVLIDEDGILSTHWDNDLVQALTEGFTPTKAVEEFHSNPWCG